MPTPIPPVHLAENTSRARRALSTGRAFPLGESDRPSRVAGTAEELERIVRYLDVENSARYARTPSNTFCNVYAYDYCYLAGVYLPRVWWTGAALDAIGNGKSVPTKYGVTLEELNANSLFDWLNDFGPGFGWAPVSSLDQLQAAANVGQVGIICAQRVDRGKPGHITVAVPEFAPLRLAERAGSLVRVPLQSQAGSRNFCSSCVPGRWWEGSQFRSSGFWIHA